MHSAAAVSRPTLDKLLDDSEPFNHVAEAAVDVPRSPEAHAAAAQNEARIVPWKPTSELLFVDDNPAAVMVTEEIRRLRSRLYHLRDRAVFKSVMVSSALPGEGKTFIATNLAHVLARRWGHRVLLIDADLRKPGAHAVLGAPQTPGLSEYLRGGLEEAAVIQTGTIEGLSFIPGGGLAQDPSELIANGGLKKLMEYASRLYDWIVVDSSPVIPTSDGTVLARFCDSVLLVVKAASTSFDAGQIAKAELKDHHVLGVVLNRVLEYSENSYAYHYGSVARSGPTATAFRREEE
jgi:capsular exopolysaccharide synthesis family protein